MVFKEVVLDFCWAFWWYVPDCSPKLLWTSGCCPLSTFLISSWRLILPLLSQAWCQKEKRKEKKSQIACVLLQSSGESTPLCRGKHLQSWSIFWLGSSRHLYRVFQTWGNTEGKARLQEGADQSPPRYTLATILRLKYIYVRWAACEPVRVAVILTHLSTGICLTHGLWWN